MSAGRTTGGAAADEDFGRLRWTTGLHSPHETNPDARATSGHEKVEWGSEKA